jgi:hypothetical protein
MHWLKNNKNKFSKRHVLSVSKARRNQWNIFRQYIYINTIKTSYLEGTVVAVIVLQLDLQLPLQLVPIIESR